MANERAWFVYNGLTGGEQTSTNYFYVSFFPACTSTGEFICSVKGIYDVDTYGNHPAPFSIDTALEQYIIDALGADVASPPSPAFKPYVYVKQNI
jgi:hypothetical protein